MSARRTLRKLERRLDRLPGHTRAMFLARRVEGQSTSLIAAAHGVSVAEVERQLVAAMLAIAEEEEPCPARWRQARQRLIGWLHRWRG